MGKRRDSGYGAAGPRRVLLGALLCALAAALVLSAPALALTQRGHTPAFTFGGYGTDAGQVNVPLGVAVSEATGDVYVVDSANNRVDRNDAQGHFIEAWGWGVGKEGSKALEKCTTTCFKGLAGKGKGELEEAEAVAVDNSTSASDPSKGDVYVEVNTNEENSAVDKFTSEGTLLEQITSVKVEKGSTEPLEELHGLAVTPSGELLISNGEEVFRFDDSEKNAYLSLTETKALEGESVPGIAVDSTGNLYLAHRPKAFGSPSLIGEVDPEGSALTQELSGEEASAVAVDSSTSPSDPYAGDILVDNLTGVTVFDSAGSPVQRIGSAEDAEKHVVPLISGSGVAINSKTGMVYVADEVNDTITAFEPEPAGEPQIDAVESAQKITSASAVLSSQIDPTGAATTFVFRYQKSGPVPGLDEPCSAPCVEAPAGEEGLGEAFGDQHATAHVQGLEPATTYHYLVIAKNEHGQVASTEESFSTEPSESTYQLPDGRQWQLVSPQEKDDASLQAITKEGGVIQASEGGEAFTYLSTGPLEGAQGARNPEFAQILSRRGAQGWSSTDIATPTEKAEGIGVGDGTEYRQFSPDLSQSLVEPFSSKQFEEPPLSKQTTEKTPYVRSNLTCEFEPEGCYTPLVTGQNVLEGTQFAEKGKFVRFVSASPDVKHVVLTSNAKLTVTQPGNQANLYEWSQGGGLQLVNLLPAGTAANIDSEGELNSVSCPTTLFCAAVDGKGAALLFKGRGNGWGSTSPVDIGHSLTSVSCASPIFCVAVDSTGHYLVASAASAEKALTWSKALSIAGVGDLTSVSCASATFCVAVDTEGHAVAYAMNAKQEMTWGTAATPDAGASIASISCTAPSFCVAVDGKGNALVDNGTESEMKWSAPASVDSGELAAVSCASSSFCTAVDRTGQALTYNGSAWSAPVAVDAGGSLTSVSCVSASFCAAVDMSGQALTYNGSTWTKPVSADTGHKLASVTCVSSSFCLAVDALGSEVTYNGAVWVAAASGAELGAEGALYRQAISSDGSRVVWSKVPSGSHSAEHLYMRDTLHGQTVQLDKPEAGVSEPGPTPQPHFQGASADGLRIFFTDIQRLTTNSTASAETSDLYVCEIAETEGHSECKLKDLSVDSNAGQSAEVQGLLPGSSEDGSAVYFVANGALAPGASQGRCRPQGGQQSATCNLYVERYKAGTEGSEGSWEAPVLVAALAQADRPDWQPTLHANDLGDITSRVSPNGNFIAFMSDRSLTGYDNTDINSGAADEEVFLYNAGTAKTICASCNPTGSRPAGVFDTLESGEGIDLLIDRPEIWQERWLSGSLPGWTSLDLTHALYQSRYLSNEGRLFFNSAEALVQQDDNGKEDVYEYEPSGLGNCTEALSTYSAKSGGCISLLSGGSSSHESAFLDASANGNDVFFLTAAPLVAQDKDTNYDVYDASVCGQAGTPACLPAPVSPPTECATLEQCRPGSPPAGAFQSPATTSVSGNGNLPPQQQVLASKGAAKPLTRAQKLAAALKLCKKDKSKSKRAACEKQARKKYGPVSKKAAHKSSAHARASRRRAAR